MNKCKHALMCTLLTTEGMNGGMIFLAIRSSQLMGEKNEWNWSSICKSKAEENTVNPLTENTQH